MPFIVPCVRGQMGSTKFYQTKMRASELVRSVRPASELDEWATMGIEERMQRELNLSRIRSQIAPYLAETKDRFFGSVLVLVYNARVYFESLDELTTVPRAYSSCAQEMGFLTIEGGSLIMLDGQHRLVALEKVLKREIDGTYADDVPNDDVCVIFIEHTSDEKTRRIFNKINRYAKPTSKGDNIITSEDDGYAVVARRLLRKGAALGKLDKKGEVALVNWRSNTLSPRSLQITNISNVYDTVKVILEAHGIKLKEKIRPAEEDLDLYAQIADEFWRAVIQGLEPFRRAHQDTSVVPRLRDDTSEWSMLFKPAVQVAVFQGLAYAVKKGTPLPEAVSRANGIDWSTQNNTWQGVILRPNGTVVPGGAARQRAGRLIEYLIAADRMEPHDIVRVWEEFNVARHADREDKYEPLPAPQAPVPSDVESYIIRQAS